MEKIGGGAMTAPTWTPNIQEVGSQRGPGVLPQTEQLAAYYNKGRHSLQTAYVTLPSAILEFSFPTRVNRDQLYYSHHYEWYEKH